MSNINANHYTAALGAYSENNVLPIFILRAAKKRKMSHLTLKYPGCRVSV
jgi:hypothetical protein